MSFTIEDAGPLKVLTFANGELNLFDADAVGSLGNAAASLAADPPRGLLIRAEGSVVSGGMDVRFLARVSPSEAAKLWSAMHASFSQIETLPCPTVFAAHALCLTAAFELAMRCDLLVATSSARFGLVEANLGVVPSLGGIQRLIERAGPACTKELVLTAGIYCAAEMQRWRVVNHVWEDEGFAARAHAFASELASGPTHAHAVAKQLVDAQLVEGRSVADGLMAQDAAALLATGDARAALASFLAEGPRHKPIFRGD